jgi:MFS family permease
MPAAPPLRDPYAALRYREFRLLFSGRFVAQIGEMMVSTAVGWELYERTGDTLALGLVGLVQVIPVILFSVPGGYIADRYNRKWITLITQLILAACSLALMFISLNQGSLEVLYGVLALIGAARAFNNPAESALTPQTVPPEHFYSAATWSSTIWQVSAIFGPALAGILIALTLNAAWVYLINVLAGLVLVAALLLMRSQQRDYASAAETPWQSIKAGWRFLRGSQVVFASIALDMFAVLLGGATFLLPVFAKDILQTDAAGLGLLRAAPSIGAVTMALIASRLPPFEKAGKTLLWAVAGFGIATIIFGLSTSFWLSLAMLALLGALDNISVIIRHTLVLTQTPDAMRGRVNAVNSIFIGASNELGGFESGYLASLLGPVGAVVIGGIGTLVVVLATACLAPKLREYGRLGSSTLQNQTP